MTMSAQDDGRAPPPGACAPDVSVIVPCYNEQANVVPMVQALRRVLAGRRWEVIFVDDNSPDGTAEAVAAIARSDAHVRCVRRIGRRGLSSAVIEGVLSSCAPVVAVMDGDLQHDEARLPDLIDAVASGASDIAVGSRHVEGGDNAGLANAWRHALSDGGIRLAQAVLPVRLTDPMSGFFAARRDLFVQTAPRLSATGFKILLDLVMSAPQRPRVTEVACGFKPRLAGESKLDTLVLIQFATMVLDKLANGWLPTRFMGFAFVGAVGVLVNLAVLEGLRALGAGFVTAAWGGTICAIMTNFWMNNRVTYADRRLRGARLWSGLALFVVVCLVGAFANVGIGSQFHVARHEWGHAAAIGAVIGVVWNYAVSSTLVWRAR
ncbi:glycosyltransferase [Ameyamaea chiangmaiensis]